MATIGTLLLSSQFLIFCGALHVQQLKSPCPNVFLYQPRDDSDDRWYGIINVESEGGISGITLKLKFDNPVQQVGNNLGAVITYNYHEYIISNNNFKLPRNSSYLLRFYVSYDPSKAIPKLIAVKKGNTTVCSGTVKPLTEIFTSVFVNSTIVSPTLEKKDEDRNTIQCGTIAAQVTPLILFGETAEVGEYPWHTALFQLKEEESQHYCGGSLISEQYVLTTAHCLRRGRTPLYPADLQVLLGATSLSKPTSNSQLREVSDIVVHPKYNGKHMHDLGLIKLKEPAVINDFVRPICLWEGDTDYELIINKTGTIVGWGLDENGNTTDDLRVANMRFASYQECLQHHPAFYVTREHYCMVTISGSTLCSGDSGAGMVVPRETSGRKVYYIRGISAYGIGVCNPRNYEVFTDVAQYLDFIKANLQ